jgi:hypothetical protein
MGREVHNSCTQRAIPWVPAQLRVTRQIENG